MLLTIHDELIFEIDDTMLEKAVPEIKKTMEGAYKLKDVELKVDSAIGKNWSDL
jgi:DNA polymerase-1